MTKSLAFSSLLILGTALLSAGPTGNFGVSHYTRLEISSRGVDVTYVLELGEVLSYTFFKKWDLTPDSPASELDARAAEEAREWAKGLEFHAGGKLVEPVFLRASIQVHKDRDGQSTSRIESSWTIPGARSPLTLEDHNYADRAGWKEIVIRAGSGVRLVKASQGSEDRSNALMKYPDIPAPQDLRASVEWAPAGSATIRLQITPVPQPPPVAAAVAPSPSSPDTRKNGGFLTRLLQMQHIPLSWMLIGLAAAVGLGGAHALTPGHGKTIVAAYLIGSRGTFKQAALLGATVTFTHTISVFLLGLATLFFAAYVNQQKISRILEAASGIGIVAVGASMLYKRIKLIRHLKQDHHGDHPHDYDHGPGGHSHTVEGDVSLHSLLALGASGGLVPCPDALVLLLFSISVGHVGAGLFLLLGFSLGLAGVLMAIGMIVLYAKQWLPESSHDHPNPVLQLIPALSAVVVVCLGLLMTGVSLGWVRPSLFG